MSHGARAMTHGRRVTVTAGSSRGRGVGRAAAAAAAAAAAQTAKARAGRSRGPPASRGPGVERVAQCRSLIVILPGGHRDRWTYQPE